MSDEHENLKKSAKEYSEKLAKLGMELGEIQFSYKMEESEYGSTLHPPFSLGRR